MILRWYKLIQHTISILLLVQCSITRSYNVICNNIISNNSNTNANANNNNHTYNNANNKNNNNDTNNHNNVATHYTILCHTILLLCYPPGPRAIL